jgi:predicted unusual protein kinase regulating ubiquinone biosynthesis (AarF/ABC1/UbiB family)
MYLLCVFPFFQVVLLDFGLVKRLPNKLRLAFSKMVVSAAQLDFSLLLESHEEMGLKLNREDGRDMVGALFFFRDTAPVEEARKAHRKNHEDMRKMRNEAPASQKNPVDAWPAEFIFFARSIELLGGTATQLGVRSARLMSMQQYATQAIREQYGVGTKGVNR